MSTENPPPVFGARFLLAEAATAVLAGLVSLALALVFLGVSPADLDLRWTLGGADQVLHYGIFASALDQFPFAPNPQLGFPEGQNLFFAPLFDLWSALFVAVLSPLAPSGVWLLNVYDLAAFFAIALTSTVFFRSLRLRRPTSVVLALVFAFVPFHFVQATGHPLLANYWCVPLIGILIVMVAGESTNPFAGWIAEGRTPAARRFRRGAPIAVLTVLVAFTQSYYFVFAIILVGGTWFIRTLVALLQRRRLGSLLWPGVTAAALLGLIVLQLALLSLDVGERHQKYFAARTAAESELYGGKFTSLVLPSARSGFGWIAQHVRVYDELSPTTPTTENPSTALIVSICIAVTLLLLLLGLFWRSAPGGNIAHSTPAMPATAPTRLGGCVTDERISVLSGAFLGGLLFFLVAGLGALFAFVVSPEIRVWSRLSIVLSLLALGVGGVLVERLVTGRIFRSLVLVVVLGVAGVDQLGPQNAELATQTADDGALQAFVSAVARDVAPSCGVVQLPLKGFPETGPIGRMGDYDEVLPYVAAQQVGGAARDLRWSYGAVAGTSSGDYWMKANATLGAFSTAVWQSGACGIMVDTFAYSDDPDGWRAFVEATGADPAVPELESADADRRYLFFRVAG